MIAATVTAEAAAYLAAVERELADLPAEERAELLEDLGLHLQALQEESDDRPLEVRLGSSAAYAAELRVAAGLPARTEVASGRLLQLLSILRQVSLNPALRQVRDFVPTLAPGWWVLRGYLLVLVPCMLYRNRLAFDHNGRPFYLRQAAVDFPVPALFGSHLLGALAIVVAVLASVKLGRSRLSTLASLAVRLASAVLLIGALVVGNAAFDRVSIAPTRAVYIQVRNSDPLSSTRGPVTNIFPFAADGTPLKGVLLYDQDGRPLNPSPQLWWGDHCARVLAQPKAADGVPVRQSYPQQYVLDPRGVTMDGASVTAGQCVETTPMPKVQLPVLPKPAH